MISINCDMGESFSLYRLGDDEQIMPYITHANVACGFHASDPNHMQRTVELAKEHGVKIGAHFSLPDLQGFGRREMKISREELLNTVVYQIGALSGFLSRHQLSMSHLKPHGALYSMAANQEPIAHAIADAAQIFGLPVMGMANCLHEEVYTARGVEFIPEFFADLDYGDKGELIVTREHEAVSLDVAAERCLRAIREGKVTSVNGLDIDVQVKTICIHSDTPDAAAVAKMMNQQLQPYLPPAQSDTGDSVGAGNGVNQTDGSETYA